MKSVDLSIGLVSFLSGQEMMARTLDSIRLALLYSGVSYFLFISEHSPLSKDILGLDKILQSWGNDCLLNYNESNPGFGIGHNNALYFKSKYHLILNPDVEVSLDAIKKAFEFMEQHPECGLLTPYATWEDGQVQRLCKRYPTVFDLFLRGFMPKIFRDLFSKRLSRYEMSDTLNDKDVYWDPPIVSGCFMLFRTEILKQIGGFDPRFFLYFEDFDISLRTAKVSRIAYVPQVKVVHHGGHASRKGWRHIKMFSRSMITFFNIHGWRWW